MKDKLIILDMDNTVLRSSIDFPRMKQVVADMLAQRGLGRYIGRSVAYTITAYQDSPDRSPELEEQIWQAVAEIEEEGLRQAVLEPGAVEALAYLGRWCELAVLTNNTENNLREQLGRLGLLPYLSCVAGRGSAPKLKPSPDGMLWVLSQYPHIDPAHTIAVGDAVNDAQAAVAAGLPFVAYNSSRKEDWERSGFSPALRLTSWDRASCDALLSLWSG